MILVNGQQLSITTFPNRERKITLSSNVLSGKNKRHVVVWQYEDDGDFLLLNMVNDWIERHAQDEIVECLILSMPYERMDRSENGNVFSLKAAIELLPVDWRYTILSPHSNKSVELMAGRSIQLYSIMPTVMRFAKRFMNEQLVVGRKLALVFPDKGAYERYGKDAIHHIKMPLSNVVYGQKVRDFDTGNIQSLDLVDVNGCKIDSLKDTDVIVIDDLSSYGGTFVRLHERLTELEANKKFLILEKTEDSILKGNLIGKYDGIYTTDLMMNIMYDSSFVPELQVLSKHEIIRDLTTQLGGF